MSSSNPGHEDEDEDGDERFYSLPLPLDHPPPHPSTSFFGASPSAPVFSPQVDIGYNQDFSLLFIDDYTQNPNYSSLENSFVTQQQQHQEIEQGGVGGAQGPDEQQSGKGGQGQGAASSSSSMMMMMKQKKMDHNAKERVRRLQLNASYLALRSLLPDSQKPKKKWSAPYIIDRTLEHIPQLEGEIEKLKSKKKDVLLEVEKVHDLRQAEQAQRQEPSTLSVSINEVKKGQVIIQICHQRNKADTFSELLFKLTTEGMEIFDAFVSDPCENRSCYHIHVQMDETSLGANYIAELKEKVVTWLS